MAKIPGFEDMSDEEYEELKQELKEVSAVLTVAEALCVPKPEYLPTLLVATCAYMCQVHKVEIEDFQDFFNQHMDELAKLHEQMGISLRPQDLSTN